MSEHQVIIERQIHAIEPEKDVFTNKIKHIEIKFDDEIVSQEKLHLSALDVQKLGLGYMSKIRIIIERADV